MGAIIICNSSNNYENVGFLKFEAVEVGIGYYL